MRIGIFEYLQIILFGHRTVTPMHNVYGDVLIEYAWRGRKFYVDLIYGDFHEWPNGRSPYTPIADRGVE